MSKLKELEKKCYLDDLKGLEKEIDDEFKDFKLDNINGFATIKELIEDFESGKKIIPHENGVYIVLLQKNDEIKFKTKKEMDKRYKKDGKEIEWYDNLNTVWKQLNEKGKTNILYIGKASGKDNKLYERIKQYVRFGKRIKPSLEYGNNHAGGRAIWQITDSNIINNLIIAWFIYKKDDDDEKRKIKGEKTAAELLENQLTIKYKIKYDDYPISNKKQGG